MNLTPNEWLAIGTVLAIMFGMIKWSANTFYEQQKRASEEGRANDREIYKLLEAEKVARLDGERKMESKIYELEIRLLREMLVSVRSLK